MEIKKTPLYQEHLRLGAKMVEFAGWSMPITYKGLKEEHLATRNHVGLFDVSHMGEIRVQGPKALETLEWLTTNEVSKLNEGDAQYSLLPNLEGGLVDDVIVYCLKKDQDYLVCVNASNADKAFSWMTQNNRGASITNESSKWAQVAVQGPNSVDLIKKSFDIDLSAQKKFTFISAQLLGHPALIAMTGYTGELGCEIFILHEGVQALWQKLLADGQSLGVEPVGLGARDTLRTEMKYSLYGHEIDENINPYEAGLGWAIKPSKKDFIGKGPMLSYKESGLKNALVGFKMLEKGIPRPHYKVYNSEGQIIGHVTSGTHSPTLDEPIGIAYVATLHSGQGSEIYVDIRGRKVKAQVVPTPFIRA